MLHWRKDWPETPEAAALDAAIGELAARQGKTEAEIIEAFIVAYFALTSVRPDEAILVRENGLRETRWYFRPKVSGHE